VGEVWSAVSLGTGVVKSLGATGGDVDVITGVVGKVDVAVAGGAMVVESVGPATRGEVVIMWGAGVLDDAIVWVTTVVGSIGAFMGDAAMGVSRVVMVVAAIVVIA